MLLGIAALATATSINFGPSCLIPEYNCDRPSPAPSRASISLALPTVVLQVSLLVLAISTVISRLYRHAVLAASKRGEVSGWQTWYLSKTGRKPYSVVEEIWSESAQAYVPRPASKSWQHGPECLFTIRLRHGVDRTDGCRPALTLHSPELVQILAQLMGENLALDSQQPEVPADDLFFLIETLRELYDRLSDARTQEHFREHAALDALLEWLDKAYSQTKTELRKSTDTDQISYKLLWCFFRHGAKGVVLHDSSGEPLGVLIESSEYLSMCGQPCFRVRGNYYAYDGEGWQVEQSEVLIPKFDGLRPITSLPITPLTLASGQSLTHRGELARQHAGLKYLQYRGALVRCMGTGAFRRTAQERAWGRCMVDAQGYWKIVSENCLSAQTHRSELDLADPDESAAKLRRSGLRRKKIRDADRWRLSPTLHGFSFVTNTWGELLVHQLSEVEFDRYAIDRIVLSACAKSWVRQLVESADQDFEPVLENTVHQKQPGVVICLYGADGSGKTSTARALAESLERPLCRIGGEELGSEASCVARKLKGIFRLASTWRAMVLIENADLFLQATKPIAYHEPLNMHYLARDALVSAFINSLKHHTGVLFLTANQVHRFDSRLISRVSAAINYPVLNQEARKQIWIDCLERAGIETTARHDRRLSSKCGDDRRTAAQKNGGKINDTELNHLSLRQYNGKMIENITRTTLRLTVSSGKTFGYTHLLEVIESFRGVMFTLEDQPADPSLINNHAKEESDNGSTSYHRVYY